LTCLTPDAGSLTTFLANLLVLINAFDYADYTQVFPVRQEAAIENPIHFNVSTVISGLQLNLTAG